MDVYRTNCAVPGPSFRLPLEQVTRFARTAVNWRAIGMPELVRSWPPKADWKPLSGPPLDL